MTAVILKLFAAAGLTAAEFAEIRSERTRLLSLVWRGAGLDSATSSRDEGGCVRVVGPSGSSFVSYTELDPVGALRHARQQATILSGEPVPFAVVPPVVGHYQGEAVEPADQMAVVDKIALLASYHRQALSAHPAVTGALIYYRESASHVRIVTSEGTEVEVERRDLTLQITIYAGSGSQRAAGSLSVGSAGDLVAVRDLAEQVEQAAATAVDLQAAPPLDAGDYDVVCDGALAGIWAHETLGHLAEADHQRGDSGLIRALRPGHRIGPDFLTITDSPGPLTARGHVPVDDEGTAAKEVVLVGNGIVDTPRVHDRATAAAFRETPTGNARALNFRHPPLPRLRTTIVAAGSHEYDDMISSLGRGLLARGFLGGQTDRIGFTFTPAECRLVIDGQVGKLVRGAVLSGDVLGTFASIDAIGRRVWQGETSASCGKQGQWPLPVSSWSPPIKLRGVRVLAG